MVLWCVVAAFAAAAAMGWGELYDWFVEPAKHHTLAATPIPYSHSDRDG